MTSTTISCQAEGFSMMKPPVKQVISKSKIVHLKPPVKQFLAVTSIVVFPANLLQSQNPTCCTTIISMSGHAQWNISESFCEISWLYSELWVTKQVWVLLKASLRRNVELYSSGEWLIALLTWIIGTRARYLPNKNRRGRHGFNWKQKDLRGLNEVFYYSRVKTGKF